MFKYNKDVIPTDCEPGVTRKILCYSDDLMMCEITFKKGSKGNFHKHEHLQITYIAKGSFEFYNWWRNQDCKSRRQCVYAI